MPSSPIITINTDASFQDGRAGLACWIVASLDGARKPTRIFSQSLCAADNPGHAEILALKVALALIDKHGWQSPTYLWNCDCQPALRALERALRGADERSHIIEQTAIEIVRSLRARNIRLIYRKVRAHSDNPDARHHVNRQVDNMARKALGLRQRESSR